MCGPYLPPNGLRIVLTASELFRFVNMVEPCASYGAVRMVVSGTLHTITRFRFRDYFIDGLSFHMACRDLIIFVTWFL